MNWISIKEMLPEKEKELLFVSNGCVYFGRYYGDSYDGWHLHDALLAEGQYGENVTHWMPLPEPPEQEKPEREICDQIFGKVTRQHCYQTKGHSGPHSTKEPPEE